MASLDFEVFGANAELYRTYDPAVMIEGPAGTGKTAAVLGLIVHRAEEYPGSRHLLLRKSKARMAQSVLVTLEQFVLPEGHPVLTPVSRSHREAYVFPNHSEVIIGGMDDPQRVMSSDYDTVVFHEATEFTIEDYERAVTRLRHNHMPHPERPNTFLNQVICDCNPSSKYHWLNVKAESGHLVRLCSTFDCNPSLTDEYLANLANLTGVRRARLFEGRWESAEGAIYPTFDPAVHVLDLDARFDQDKGKWKLWTRGQNATPKVEINSCIAGADWGYRNPGALVVIGVDDENNAYVLRQVYRVEKDLEWWADRAEELRRRFNIIKFVCDPSRPENINRFNTRMIREGGYSMARREEIAGGARNAIAPGLSIVRERLDNRTFFVLSNGVERRDPILLEKKQPTSLEEEFPAYCYREVKEGQPVREEPAPGSVDHLLDATRYALTHLDDHDLRSFAEPDRSFGPATYGALLGHAEVLEASAWGECDEDLFWATGGPGPRREWSRQDREDFRAWQRGDD